MRVLLVAALLSCTACQPTGVRVCDRNTAALVIAEVEGYRYDCTPTEVDLQWHMGWADHANRILYVVPDGAKRTADVMWHELGHAVWENRGYTGTQAQEERWADGYSWCHYPQQGISYQTKPTDCAPYFL
jgi:hypothetical protein